MLLPHWQYDVQINGIRKRRSTRIPIDSGKEGKRAAERIEASARLEIAEAQHFPQGTRRKMSMGELHALVLKEKADRRSQTTLKSIWKRLVVSLGETTPVHAITEERIDELRRELSVSIGRFGRPLAPSTVNRHISFLRSGLVIAKKHRAIKEIPRTYLLAEDNERDRVWTLDELAFFMAKADIYDPSVSVAIAIGYWTGLRLGAIVDLRWENIDLQERLIRVPQLSSRAKKRARFVPVHIELVKLLEPRHRGSGPVCSKSARLISHRFCSLKKKLAEAGEIEDRDIHFHDLRHSAATNLWEAGADLATIMAITGHRTTRSLIRYLTARPQKLLEAMDRVQPGEPRPARPAEPGEVAGLSTEDLLAEIQRRLTGNDP